MTAPREPEQPETDGRTIPPDRESRRSRANELRRNVIPKIKKELRLAEAEERYMKLLAELEDGDAKES